MKQSQSFTLNNTYKLQPFSNDELIEVYCQIGGYVVSLWLSVAYNEHYVSVHTIEGKKENRSWSGANAKTTAILFALAMDNGIIYAEQFAEITTATITGLIPTK